MLFVKNYRAGSAEVDMLLYSGIGYSTDPESGLLSGTSGEAFANELNYLANNSGVKRIRLRINSPGGLVLDGLAILAAMIQLNQGEKIAVDTFVDGIAGSMAGIIAAAGKRRYAMDYARLMIHAPSGGDDETLNQLSGILANVLNLQVNDPDLKDIFKSGADRWYTAKEAKARGYIDEIVKTGRAPLEIKNGSQHNILSVAASAVGLYEKIQRENMETAQIRAALKIGETDDVAAAIAGLTAKAALSDALKAEVATLKTGVATAHVDAAILAGKFAKENRETLIAQASKDPESFITMAASMTVVAARVPIAGAAGGALVGYAVDDFGVVRGPGLPDAGMTFRQLDKVEMSAKIKATAPDVWSKAYKIQYPESK